MINNSQLGIKNYELGTEDDKNSVLIRNDLKASFVKEVSRRNDETEDFSGLE